jgi:hypothetical protein
MPFRFASTAGSPHPVKIQDSFWNAKAPTIGHQRGFLFLADFSIQILKSNLYFFYD